MGFGETLRNTRINKQITLEQIEEDTKIRRMYLEAIEDENFAVLPPRVYAIGFVKKYVRYLGLDESQLIEEFKQMAYGGQNQEEESALPSPGRHKSIPVKNILAGILFFIIVVWVGNYLVGFISEAMEKNINKDPGANIGIQEPKEPDQTDIGKIPVEVETPADTVTLSIKALSDCWLRAIVDGEKVFEAELQAGEEKNLEGKQSVYIKLGNAGGVEISYNGEVIEPLGQPGAVAEREFLLNEQSE
ncbi:MAG: helix-turn-helix domain-containing protein [Syntrophomonadaceae bacterium]|jgi:cytoskeletal protein RodZ|nr:helix-turn-helix domain-containing protein [Syntrophomonadaceae bacterium]